MNDTTAYLLMQQYRQNPPGRHGSSFPVRGRQTPDRLTNLAAIQLTEEGYGNIACLALLAIGAEGLVANAKTG